MPELDPDLVTLLTLGLLGLIVLCLLGVMSSIGRVRKAIERAAAQRERDQEDRRQSSAPATGVPVKAAAEPEPAIERRPEPVAAREPEPASETQQSSAYDPATSSAGAGNGPGVVAADSSTTGSRSAASYAAQSSESTPSSGTSTASESATSTSSSLPAQTTQEPQEQPFERDGRWWFRRGSELLVYDEGTGQWLAAPEDPSRHGSSATQPIPTTISSVSESEESSNEAGTSGEQQGFWKCPSCGAVNGSTATSCRMCFTARP